LVLDLGQVYNRRLKSKGLSIVANVLFFIAVVKLTEYICSSDLSIMKDLLDRSRALWSNVLDSCTNLVVVRVVWNILQRHLVAQVNKDSAERP